MSSIFISYARENRDVASRLALVLADNGHSVWWDRELLAGEIFDKVISEQLSGADCIITLWTEESLKSHWVRDEADEALQRGVLLPIALGGAQPPIGFRRIQCLEAANSDHLFVCTMIDSVLSAVEFIASADADELIERRSNRPSDRRDEATKSALRHELGDAETKPSREMVISKVFVGFIIALLSSVFWGFGNAITKWTVNDFGNLAAEVAIMKFFCAGIFLWILGLAVGRKGEIPTFQYYDIFKSVARQWVAVLATAVNVLTFVFALNLLPAASVTSIENAHVIWTALILVLFFRQSVPAGWIASSVMVLIGVVLITQVDPSLTDKKEAFGYALSIISGFTLSVFTISWAEGKRPELAALRIFEAGALLVYSALTMIALHACFMLIGGEVWIPRFEEIPKHHFLVQFFNALVGIGVTYILMNEAFAYVSVEGRLASLLIGLGISFAVLFTFVGEVIIFEREVVLLQWVGVIAFSIGFATVRNALINPTKDNDK